MAQETMRRQWEEKTENVTFKRTVGYGMKFTVEDRYNAIMDCFTGWGAGALNTLRKDQGKPELPLRTLQRIHWEWAREDYSLPWDPFRDDPEDARLALDMVCWLIDVNARKNGLTEAEAGMVIWLRKACPDMPLEHVWYLTNVHLAGGDPDVIHDMPSWLAVHGWAYEDMPVPVSPRWVRNQTRY